MDSNINFNITFDNLSKLNSKSLISIIIKYSNNKKEEITGLYYYTIYNKIDNIILYIKIGQHIINFDNIYLLNNSYYYILDKNNEQKPFMIEEN